jgi:hypothetical protein
MGRARRAWTRGDIRASAAGLGAQGKRGTGQSGPVDDTGEAVSLGCCGAGAASARRSGKSENRAGTGGVRLREEGEK